METTNRIMGDFNSILSFNEVRVMYLFTDVMNNIKHKYVFLFENNHFKSVIYFKS